MQTGKKEMGKVSSGKKEQGQEGLTGRQEAYVVSGMEFNNPCSANIYTFCDLCI